MKEVYVSHISSVMGLKTWQVENCIDMFAAGDTIPFISRYRKEKTGGLDDAQVAELKHWADVFSAMEKRKETILSTIEGAGALTDELRAKIENCVLSAELEDLYLPYRPKRRTRATVAKEKGLEPLADAIWNLRARNVRREAEAFVKGDVQDVEEALAGARDIICERLSETPSIRENQRRMFRSRRIVSKATKAARENPAEASRYRSYFDFSYPLDRIPSHNLLAILRAEAEGFVSVGIDVDAQRAASKIYGDFCAEHGSPSGETAGELRLAAEDTFKRLIEPSVGPEVIREAKARADVESIRVFGENLRELLLSPPVGQKRTMAVDPGYRNGCKVACIDAQGNLLDHAVVFPHPPQNEKVAAITKIQEMVDRYSIEAVAVGNGTASRETIDFMKRIRLPEGCRVWTVSEDGASVYSASEAGRREFPDEDVTVRGAVSIARRLMDPLSELVKIDPKSLGVGQYQHDVDQALLKEKLDNTVESCVNAVGVNLNTASMYLLSYVAGIGPALAEKIVEYRAVNGAFKNREQLRDVPRLGAVAFRQCAGFLRIKGGDNPLDDSAVHPESYPIVDRMAADLGVKAPELVGNDALCSKLEAERYVGGEVGLPTVNDIIRELRKPGLDPRDQAVSFSFADDVRSFEDLRTGMELPGIVTNITNFGAFVDIGLHENGLIHVSRLKGTNLKLHQHITVTVLDIDEDRRRISLGPVKKTT